MQAIGEATNTKPLVETLIDWAVVSWMTKPKHCAVIPPIADSEHNGLMLRWAWKKKTNTGTKQD